MTILDAARRSQLEGLEAMRDKLAADMDAAEPSYSAQLAARLQAVLSEIEAIRKAQPSKGSRIDELERKRAERSGDGAPVAQRRASARRNRDNRASG